VIRVLERVRLDVPPAVAWAWLSDLERLLTVNLFHAAAFVPAGPPRPGVRVRLDHRWGPGPTFHRQARLTHWEPLRRVGWVEIEPRHPKGAFPHSQQITLAPLGAHATLLTNELRGSLNLPFIKRPADRLAQRLIVAPVVRRECAYLRAHIVAP
jgi:hypothetical protein